MFPSMCGSSFLPGPPEWVWLASFHFGLTRGSIFEYQMMLDVSALDQTLADEKMMR